MKKIYIKSKGLYLQITPLTGSVIRLRVSKCGTFEDTATETMELINSSWEQINFEENNQDDSYSIRYKGILICLNLKKGTVTFENNRSTVITMEPYLAQGTNYAGLLFKIKEDEKFYGLGYRKTDYIQLRGKSLRNHVTYGKCYGPNPFLMSSDGWGVFLNTTYDSYFDIGKTVPDILNTWCEECNADFYIMTGQYSSLLKNIGQITGMPYKMPLWAYGLMFICNEKENQFNVLNDALNFMDRGIPCDMLGLEPGWMSTYYDATVEKDWDREKFYMPWWDDNRKLFQDVTFLGALKRHGFNLSFWLCCDYDIFAAEKQKEVRTNPNKIECCECDETDFDPNGHNPIYMDKITDRNQPWFEHLKKFIDSGVVAFKQDPAYIINDHPDRMYANGMTDQEAHNIYSTVLAKQIYKGYKSYTQKRPMCFLGAAYFGIQHWAPTWTCDCGGGNEALIGIIQHSLCGHMNVTCDMDVHSIEGIHFGFLLPWCIINSWASIEHPWWLEEKMFQSFTFYANLHYSLIPYIYSYAHVGFLQGMPIVRSMPLKYPDDRNCENLTHQYLLGDYLLVGAFTKTIYLPEGKWIDFWTEKVYEGGNTIRYIPPQGRGGPLFVKEGAILPCWDNAKKSVSKNNERLILNLYPCEKSSCFSLYEDDGESFNYEKGEVAETQFNVEMKDDTVIIKVENQNTQFRGFDGKRKIRIKIHYRNYKKVMVNDRLICKGGSVEDDFNICELI